MEYRVLTEAEWDALADAEAGIYANEMAMHPVTGVRDREDCGYLASIWDDAMSSVDMFVPDGPTQTKIVAERVARAQYFIMLGAMPTQMESYETRKFMGQLRGGTKPAASGDVWVVTDGHSGVIEVLSERPRYDYKGNGWRVFSCGVNGGDSMEEVETSG